MRSILLDELRADEIEAAHQYLAREARPSDLEGLYWIDLPTTLWNNTQQAGSRSEEGYKIAVEVEPDQIRFELLVRSDSLANLGGGPADPKQALFILNWADRMAEILNFTSCRGALDQDNL